MSNRAYVGCFQTAYLMGLDIVATYGEDLINQNPEASGRMSRRPLGFDSENFLYIAAFQSGIDSLVLS